MTTYYDESYPPSLWTPDPNIASISPTTAVAGSGPGTLTVNGTNFQPTSVIEFDQTAQPTTYVSDTRLTAPFTPTVAGSRVVTVRNGGSGGEESNSVTFTVTAAEFQAEETEETEEPQSFAAIPVDETPPDATEEP